MSKPQYKVADMTLAEFGRKEIVIAEGEVSMSIEEWKCDHQNFHHHWRFGRSHWIFVRRTWSFSYQQNTDVPLWFGSRLITQTYDYKHELFHKKRPLKIWKVDRFLYLCHEQTWTFPFSDARSDGHARQVRSSEAVEGSEDRRMSAHDHPNRRAHRDPCRARSRGAVVVVQHLLHSGMV